MVHISEWPHGHIVVDWSCTERAVRYCVEYVAAEDKKSAWLSMSKKPALGAAWFARKAEQAREFGVLPSSFEYMPPGGRPGRKYLMTGATRRDYLNAITKDRADRPRMSEWVAKTFDKLERGDYIKGLTGGFDDEAFLSRQMPEGKMRSLMAWREGLDEIAADRMTDLIAAEWGFDDVEEFKAFVEAGGCQAHPEYWRGAVHVPDRAGAAGAGADAPRTAARRAPTGYDRQGKPYWGEPGTEYLAGAYDRSGPAGPGADALAESGGTVGPGHSQVQVPSS
jgi:hypothetical protein